MDKHLWLAFGLLILKNFVLFLVGSLIIMAVWNLVIVDLYRGIAMIEYWQALILMVFLTLAINAFASRMVWWLNVKNRDDEDD